MFIPRRICVVLMYSYSMERIVSLFSFRGTFWGARAHSATRSNVLPSCTASIYLWVIAKIRSTLGFHALNSKVLLTIEVNRPAILPSHWSTHHGTRSWPHFGRVYLAVATQVKIYPLLAPNQHTRSLVGHHTKPTRTHNPGPSQPTTCPKVGVARLSDPLQSELPDRMQLSLCSSCDG